MVAVVFCTEISRHVNYSVSNQDLTSSSKPLQWIQCAEQIHIQMFKLPCFWCCVPTFKFLRTLLCNLRRWSCTFDICLASIFLESLTSIFCFLPSLFTSTLSARTGHLVATFFTWNISKHRIALYCKMYTARHRT